MVHKCWDQVPTNNEHCHSLINRDIRHAKIQNIADRIQHILKGNRRKKVSAETLRGEK